MCYHIEDVEIQPIEGLPLIYEWDLGDGTVERGLSIDHCYEKEGVYQVTLNIIDTLTDQIFMDVSTSVLEIIDYEQPFILSHDSVVVGYPMTFFSDDSPIKKYKTAKHYWIVDDTHHFEGDTLIYTFNEPGYHNVLCGAVSNPNELGQIQKSCSYKTILVLGEETFGFPQLPPDPSIEPVNYIKLRDNVEVIASTKKAEVMLYRIVIAEAESRIPLNDPVFKDINEEIVETISPKGPILIR
ncbi:MAG: PKD domain-containing protein [Flavobacteriales bacterium]